MKKCLLLIVVILSFQFNTKAGDFKFGLTSSYCHTMFKFSNNPSAIDTDGYSIYTPNIVEAKGFSFGPIIEIPISGTSIVSLIFKITYSHLPGRDDDITTTEDSYPVINQKGDTTWTEVKIREASILDVQYGLLSGDMSFKIKPIEDFIYLVAGIDFGYAVNKHVTLLYNIDGPPEYDFSNVSGVQIINNNRTMILRNDDMPEASRFRLGFSLAVQMDLKLSKFSISPFALFNGGLTNLESRTNNSNDKCYYCFNSLDWKIHYYQYGVDISIPF